MIPQNSDFSPTHGPNKRSLVQMTLADQEHDTEVNEILREISDKCSAALQSMDENRGLKRQRGESEAIHMYGVFHGLQTCSSQNCLDLSGSELEEGVSFRTSINEHCNIRTLAFPQGNAFTVRTASGGYRFRWVPSWISTKQSANYTCLTFHWLPSKSWFTVMLSAATSFTPDISNMAAGYCVPELLRFIWKLHASFQRNKTAVSSLPLPVPCIKVSWGTFWKPF